MTYFFVASAVEERVKCEATHEVTSRNNEDTVSSVQ
jgi:hypothetical protein